jgi:prophage antirepressor-like protein
MQTLTFNSQQIRIERKDGNVWFCAADVARAIGYKNTAQAIADNVSPKYICQICLGGKGRKPLFISEAGLYELIMKSNLPAASTFQHWVYENVLPSIRRTGQYVGQMPLTELGNLMADLPALIMREDAKSTQHPFKVRDVVTVDFGKGDRRECKILSILGNYIHIKFADDTVDIVTARQVLFGS